jgi:ankyrin repeat protein
MLVGQDAGTKSSLIHLNCKRANGLDELKAIARAYHRFNQLPENGERRDPFLNHLIAADSSGAQPIHLAAECLNLEIIHWLVAEGVQPHFALTSTDNSVIHIMCSTEHYINQRIDALRQFMKRHSKRSLNFQNILGQTPLHIAVSINGPNNTDLISFLITEGANPIVKDVNGKTPLSIAISNKCKALAIGSMLTNDVLASMTHNDRLQLCMFAVNEHASREVLTLLMKKLQIDAQTIKTIANATSSSGSGSGKDVSAIHPTNSKHKNSNKQPPKSSKKRGKQELEDSVTSDESSYCSTNSSSSRSSCSSCHHASNISYETSSKKQKQIENEEEHHQDDSVIPEEATNMVIGDTFDEIQTFVEHEEANMVASAVEAPIQYEPHFAATPVSQRPVQRQCEIIDLVSDSDSETETETDENDSDEPPQYEVLRRKPPSSSSTGFRKYVENGKVYYEDINEPEEEVVQIDQVAASDYLKRFVTKR